MRISAEKNGDVLWLRDSDTQEGETSLGYLKDGTQQEIIAALEDALKQAKGVMPSESPLDESCNFSDHYASPEKKLNRFNPQS